MNIDLDAIEARANAAIVERESNFLDLRQFAPVIRAIDESSTDVPALLALVREQQAKLDAVRDLAEEWESLGTRHPLYAHFAAYQLRAAITATEEDQ